MGPADALSGNCGSVSEDPWQPKPLFPRAGHGVLVARIPVAPDARRRIIPEHPFEPRALRFIKISTRGCHGLTFPSFSRLTEVMAFER